MANVHLSDAVNVKAVYAGRSLSLFMDLLREMETVAECSNSLAEELPVKLSLRLRRIDKESGRPLGAFHSTPHHLSSYPLHEDGVGNDAVQFATSGGSLLKVTIDLGVFPFYAKPGSLSDGSCSEYALINQSWMIDSKFCLVMRMDAKARTDWPPVPETPWGDATEACVSVTPRSLAEGDENKSVQGSEEATRDRSASRNTTGRSPRSSTHDTSAPRFRVKGPLYMDQALFPFVRIFFYPQQYTEPIRVTTVVLRNMTVQVGVEHCPQRRSGKPARRPLRDRSATENLFVLDPASSTNSTLGAESTAVPRQDEAICLVFNAHSRQLSKESATAYDVAYAKRLVVEGYVFEVLVTAAVMRSETVESVWRAIQAYHYETGSVRAVDMNIDDAVGDLVQRFSYINDSPSLDVMDFYNTVWEALRLYMVTNSDSDAPERDLEDNSNKGELCITDILMDV